MLTLLQSKLRSARLRTDETKMSKYGMKQALRESVLECLQFLLSAAADRTDRRWGPEVTSEQAKKIASNLGDMLVAALTFAVSSVLEKFKLLLSIRQRYAWHIVVRAAVCFLTDVCVVK